MPSINVKRPSCVVIFEDLQSDGNEIEYDRIRTAFELNDFVFVELLSIDEATYEYYSTLGNAIASSSGSKIQTKIPANPNSNISGNALGYFGAFTVRSDSVWKK